MSKIVSIPSDDNGCAWFHLSPPRKVLPKQLRGNIQADWVVVGAGFTGLSTARQLALNFPEQSIILVEAQEVGFGSSGRNSGFLIDLPHDIGASDYIGDITTAGMQLKLNQEAQNIIKRLVAEYKIDCQLEAAGKYQAAVESRGLMILESYKRGLDKLGQDSEIIQEKDLPKHFGTSFYKKALYTPGTLLVQPAALVQGLATNLPSNVTLFENTPITEIEYGKKITLKSHSAILSADKLILTNNAFASKFGFLKSNLLPIFTYASMTRTLDKNEQELLGGKKTWGIIPADPFGTTLRRTNDQRLLIRNSFSFNPSGVSTSSYLQKVKKRHNNSFKNRFPMLPNVEFEFTWGGAMNLSRNHESFFGKLGPNVYGALCWNGLGTTKGTIAGTLLANWLAGERSELIDFLLASPGPNPNPPEPFLSLGVNLNLMLGQYRSGQEC
ncbi:NAD(P)/FAD-dependent oxidoreductase [Acinetobacter pseudolwoffii]|uniref:NAD(P)/FAD-dependent oxidoreductase n=1 Tax=Acinetobacter pseudolwoffii TaxID=2053287 RepID=UPI00246908E6|nr:FAD-binding oxidoreductase [Acinetobacter pseudolwoffii]MDH5818683.1 FAD-binding oxidoreductase [Acinetobacter pseudolwoffii]